MTLVYFSQIADHLHKNDSVDVLQACPSERNFLPLKHYLLFQNDTISALGHLSYVTLYSFSDNKKHFDIYLYLSFAEVDT